MEHCPRTGTLPHAGVFLNPPLFEAVPALPYNEQFLFKAFDDLAKVYHLEGEDKDKAAIWFAHGASEVCLLLIKHIPLYIPNRLEFIAKLEMYRGASKADGDSQEKDQGQEAQADPGKEADPPCQ